MQYLEYGFYDIDSNEKETQENIDIAIKYMPSVISVLPQYVRQIKKIIPEYIRLSTIIDYPFGLSDTLSREHAVRTAIDDGIDNIEIICPNYFLCNRKYDRFRIEVDKIKLLCSTNKINIRYILEYKLYTLDVLQKIASILYTKNITTIYPSSSYSLDNIADNIIVAMMIIKKNPNINVIVNGQAWTDEHINLILSNPNINSYKTTNIHTLEKIFHKIKNHNKI